MDAAYGSIESPPEGSATHMNGHALDAGEVAAIVMPAVPAAASAPVPRLSREQKEAVIDDLARMSELDFIEVKKARAIELGYSQADLTRAVTGRRKALKAEAAAEARRLAAGQRKQQRAASRPAGSALPEDYRYTEWGGIEYLAGQGTGPLTGEMKEVWEWLCSPLEILAETRDIEGKNWGVKVRIKARGGEGRWHTQIIPQAICIADGGELFGLLAGLGMKITPDKKGKDRLRSLLCLASPGKLVRTVTQTGWHGGNAFVLPDEAFGALGGEEIEYRSEQPVKHLYATKGSYEAWRHEVAAKAIGNSRLIFGLAAAFAGPFLQPLDMQGGGFHIHGRSSGGKSICFTWAAGSVWGGGGKLGFGVSWNTSRAGAEGQAVAHSDTILNMDELGEAMADAVWNLFYMFGNGMGKARGGIMGEARPIAQFAIIYLSSGEVSLETKLKEKGFKLMAGQEVRCAEIEANAGAGMGAFEDIHGAPNAEAFTNAIEQACKKNYGHAARMFLRRLFADRAAAVDEIERLMRAFLKHGCPDGAAAQVKRVAKRFALVAAAGELAAAWNILPWPEGTAMKGTKRMFDDWLKQRGTAGDRESIQAILQVRGMIERHGASRFMPIDGKKKAEGVEAAGAVRLSEQVRDRLGYVKRPLEKDDTEGEIFYVLPGQFKDEICKGLNYRLVAQELKRIDALELSSKGECTKPAYISGLGTNRYYVIKSNKLFAEAPPD